MEHRDFSHRVVYESLPSGNPKILFTDGRAWEPDLLREADAALDLPLTPFREALERSERATRNLVFLRYAIFLMSNEILRFAQDDITKGSPRRWTS